MSDLPSGPSIGTNLPRGVESLLKLAATDDAFRLRLLADDPVEVAGAAGLALDPAEAEMLRAIPVEQLEKVICALGAPALEQHVIGSREWLAAPDSWEWNSLGIRPDDPVRRDPAYVAWVKKHREIRSAIERIDALISGQLRVIFHAPEFRRLEAAWRGLNYLVWHAETGLAGPDGGGIVVKVLNVSKQELAEDFGNAPEWEQSFLFQVVYDDVFRTRFAYPFAVLVGDYQFTPEADDVDLLRGLAGVASAAFCPIIAAAAPELLGVSCFTELCQPRNLAEVHEKPEFAKWQVFRDSEDSRFVVLTLPRVLSRLPYGKETRPVEEFDFEECVPGASGRPERLSHEHFAWMNTAFVYAGRLTDSFARTGSCSSIRGKENGGLVEGVPCYVFKSMEGAPDDSGEVDVVRRRWSHLCKGLEGDLDFKCPTEISIADRAEAELSKLGFLPLCHCKNTDYSVFFGGQTCQKPKKYDEPGATDLAAISAKMPFIMATTRIAHYLKVIARDRPGGFSGPAECADALQRWIEGYVCPDPRPTPEMKARYPLAAAGLKVNELPGLSGLFAIVWLQTWLHRDLLPSLRIVVRLPEPAPES